MDMMSGGKWDSTAECRHLKNKRDKERICEKMSFMSEEGRYIIKLKEN